MYFLIIVALEIPCFWYYILGLFVLLFLFVLTWIEVIQIYHFLITLSIILFLFPLFISFIVFETCGFSNQYSKLISLRRYHFLPIISIAHATLRTMFSLFGGRVEEGSFLLFMLSYFGHLVDFCLILKFFKVFYSNLHGFKGKIFKLKWEKLNCCFSLDLEFVLCLLKLMNCWSFYWIHS